MSDTSWIGPAISAVGNIGGGIAQGASQSSSDGFSQKGAGEAYHFAMATEPKLIKMRLKAYEDAGIHPLAALGQNLTSGGFSVGGTGGYTIPGKDYGISKALDGMGQDISRAQMAKDTPIERKIRENDALLSDEAVKQAGLDTAIKQKTLDDMNKTPTSPLAVNDLGEVVGQSRRDIQVSPAQVTPIDPRTGKEVGVSAALKNFRYDKDTLMPGKTQQYAESTEEDLIGGIQYGLMRARDYFKGWKNPPTYPSEDPGAGNYWKYNKAMGVWERKHRVLRSRKKATKGKYDKSNRSKRKMYRKLTTW